MTVCRSVSMFKPFTILNLDSKEQKSGTSLSNPSEAHLAVHLFELLKQYSRGLSTKNRVAIITPYAQQANLLRNAFNDKLGPEYERYVEINTVDAFQGREANIVIFSAVRASENKGIGFLSDVRRMNVALTRAKYFLFVIARVQSIVKNPYWNELVEHARDTKAVIHVPFTRNQGSFDFMVLNKWEVEESDPSATRSHRLGLSTSMTCNASVSKDPRLAAVSGNSWCNGGDAKVTKAPSDPRKQSSGSGISKLIQPKDARARPIDAIDSSVELHLKAVPDAVRPTDPRKRSQYG